MTSLAGQNATSQQGGSDLPALSSSLGAFDGDKWPPHEIDMQLTLSGSATRVSVNAHARSLSGGQTKDYTDDFYYHLVLRPSTIDLRNILTAQTRQVTLWNAYFEDVEVTDISVLNGSGVTLTPPVDFPTTPFTLKPLQQITYDVSISLAGPPKLDATIAWSNDHEDDATLHLIGSRITVFPFLPDWAPGIDEVLSARSSVLRSPDGDEQSISLRQRFRRSYAIPYTLQDEQAQYADNLLFGWQDKLFGVPAWPEQGYTTAAITAGSSDVVLPTAGRTLLPGVLVMVFAGKDVLNAEIREVLSVTSSGFKTTEPFVNAWPSGVRVVPLLLGAAAPQLQGTQLVPNLLQIGVQFDLEPSTTDDNAPVVAPAATYRGYEVYLGRTNWRDNLSINMQNDVMRVDFETGIFRLVPQSGFSGIGRSHTWFLKTLADVSSFRSWLKRRLGKTTGVWMPSATDDFTLAETVGSATTSFQVKSNGYALLVNQNESRRDIYVRLANGHYFLRRIVSSTDGGGGTTLLQIDTAFGEQIAPGDVKQFSFLSFYRVSSDNTTIHWHVPGKAEAVTGLIPTKALQ